jgi:hypothetical protein
LLFVTFFVLLQMKEIIYSCWIERTTSTWEAVWCGSSFNKSQAGTLHKEKCSVNVIKHIYSGHVVSSLTAWATHLQSILWKGELLHTTSFTFIAGYEDEWYGNFAGLPNLMHMLILAFLVQSSNKHALRLWLVTRR